MIVILPLPLEPDELKSLSATLRVKYNLSLEDLLRNSLYDWEMLGQQDSPAMDGLFIVGAMGVDDFNEWFEASKRLTDISHRIGQKIYEQLDPGLKATFDGDEVAVSLVKCLPNGIMLNLKRVVEES